MTLNQLYDIADENNIQVYHYPLSPIKSMSVPGFIGMDMDEIQTSAEEKEHLAHEVGHCMMNAFYTGISPYELRSKKEYQAIKWTIKNLIPFPEFFAALENGYTELWQLSEYFEVSENLIAKAYNLYEEKLLKASVNN